MSQLDRQSFLGLHSHKRLAEVQVGLIGLGGGGSHVAQQLAHVGVGGFVLVDPDHIESSNLNRLVGGTHEDIAQRRAKTEIAARLIRSINPDVRIEEHVSKWQEAIERLKCCDLIVGGLDSVIAKDDLDRFCRRFLIPYIDMGMDVHTMAGGRYLIAGQVALVLPGSPCLRCMGIVTEEGLIAEAQKYGAAGGNPQVVWPNGLLASAAVGLAVQMICPWNDQLGRGALLEYDGNKHTLRPSGLFAHLQAAGCAHNHPDETGEMLFDIRRHIR
jgi:molybdopterin/thiamine biosynthesis adenylyltransferase